MAYRLLIGSVLTVALGGCGSVTPAAPDGAAGNGGGDAPVERTPATTAEGCKAVAKALCDTLDGCAPAALKVFYGDKTICATRAELGCTTDQAVPGIARTADDLVACAQALGPASCAELVAGRSPAACEIAGGTTKNGVACGSDWQCESTYCNKTGMCGVCGPRQAAGGACTVDQGCAKGLVCAANKCTAPGATGAACKLPEQPCRSDLYCTSMTASGTCAAKVGAGGACADSSDACDFIKGVICNGVTKTCETVTVNKGGEACGLALKAICVGFIEPCQPNILVGGICANPAQDGESCGTGGKKCVPPATCEMNVCRLPSTPDCH